jgi:membrane protease YdiL (CAAX protease family)
MGKAAERAARPVPALAACIGLLTVWVVLVRPGLPPVPRLVGGLVVAGCTVALALWAGLDADGLGLSPRRLTDGLRYGGLAFGAVTVVILLGVAIPATRHAFHSGRADITAGQLLVQVPLTIPLGTVVVEELAFRGALLGLFRLAMPTARAVVACSVLFGLWHVPSVVAATSGSDVRVLAAVTGTFVATFAAGVAFCWLRIRSGSLLAPAMAHLATNAVALVAAWLVVH